MPPRIKVLEALSAIADGRVRREGDHYVIISSDGSRSYIVYVDEARGLVYSNDNGTAYRGYVGYPIVAGLMMLGLLSFSQEVGEGLGGIPWRGLNERDEQYGMGMGVISRRVGEGRRLI